MAPIHAERRYERIRHLYNYHDIPIHTEIAINSAYEYVMVLACLRAVSERFCADAHRVVTRWIQKIYLHLQ